MFKRPCFAFVIAASAFVFGQSASAQPLEYVRVCDVYGTGFFYIPGTEVCLNAVTGETRQETEGGTLRTMNGYAPAQWVSNPAAGCLGGTVANLGTLGQASFSLNDFKRYEAALASVNLGEGDFISTFMMTGTVQRLFQANGEVRFTGVAGAVIPEGTVLTRTDDTAYLTSDEYVIGDQGSVEGYAYAVIGGPGGALEEGAVLTLEQSLDGVNATVEVIYGFPQTGTGSADLCLSFRDANNNYFPLGCESVNGALNKVATVAFSPRATDFPADMVAPVGIVASGREWRGDDKQTLTLTGQVTVSACIRNVSADGAVCRVVPSEDASSVTLSCGTTSEKIANGTSCTVTEHGNGTATMTCPDGSSVALLTQAAAGRSNDDDGCNSAPGSSAFLIAAVVLFRAIRSRGRSVKLSA